MRERGPLYPSHQSPVEFTSVNPLKIESIPPEQIVERLEMADLPPKILMSIKGSLWGRIDNGRKMLEGRSMSILQQPRTGIVNVIDFDDCLISASRWHQEEYRLLAENEVLRKQGINITAQRAKDIYELSKILIPNIVEKEPRYTPKLNLILLSIYANALREGLSKEQTEEQTWQELLKWREMIKQQTQDFGERALKAYAIDPTIQTIFMSNPPAGFLYTEFVQSVLGKTGPNDIRVIATRGKIEGPLGQVHKIHASGLMRQRSVFGQRVDLVIYSNDVKAEALLSMMKLLPNISDRLIRVYDDNPNEILPYLELARGLGVRNIEIVQVSHPDAKRKDIKISAEPTLTYKTGETRLSHYSPVHIAK